MNRKLLNGLLVLTVAAGGVVTFTSCKDEDFRMNTELADMHLQSQINQIRETQEQLFNDWLNDLTKQYSEGRFDDYEAMVQAATELWDVYQSILSDTLSDEAAAYVDALYEWMFDRNIKTSDWYDLIFSLADRASSVGVLQVKNPIFGSVNLPLDVKSTILATYLYQGANAEYMFPYGISGHFSDNSPVKYGDASEIIEAIQSLITEAESFELKNGQFTDNGQLGNMGYAVVNINPTSNDYTSDKYTVELVNTKGDVVLSTTNKDLALSAYDEMLYFGATRAASATGLYALNVNATEANNAALSVDLDKTALKNSVKQLIDNKSISNVANLGTTVLSSFNNKLPAYQVRVSWQENVVDPETGEVAVDEDGVALPAITNSVTSSDLVAAAVVHPLSYGSDLGQFVPSDKQLPVVHNSLSQYFKKFKDKFTVILDDLYFEEINMGDVEVNFKVEIRGGYVYFEAYDENGVLTEQEPIKIAYTGTGIAASDEDLTALVQAIQEAMSIELDSTLKYKLMNQLNSNFAEINEQITNLKGDVNDWLSKIENKGLVDYGQTLLDFYNRIAEKANDFLKDPNRYLQVVMALNQGNGVKFMSNDIYMPQIVSKANGSKLDLITTSYTGDIVIPSYKKYVAITGYQNMNARASLNYMTDDLAQYNKGDLNKVYDGHKEKIQVDLSTLEAGLSYRLTYVSVDYRGVCSVENYYLTVVE